MAVSQIEVKILGRLARQTSFPTRTRPGNEALSASFFQVLGLSILLSKKLVKARRLRKLDTTRDTKSLQLYHHIIWLAREGLAITEAHILPYCQNGESGPECRVMAAKLRASFCHVFCLFHNFPPVTQLSAKSQESGGSPSSVLTPKADNGQTRRSPAKSPRSGKENNGGRRSRKKGVLRDPIPSMNSDTSYVTNPYAVGPAQTPPPAGPPPPLPPEARRTPTRPPGLTPIDIPASQAAASFLLPPMNWVPLTVEHFGTAQRLAESLLPPAHALRLSIALEHAAFLWDCEKNHPRARHIARKTIKDVYASTEGLDDDEFLDASSLVQALGGIVRRGSNESTPRPSQEQIPNSPPTTTHAPPPIDRTIAVSPTKSKQAPQSPAPLRSILKTPDRLSTVPEVISTEAFADPNTAAPSHQTLSPPVSRLSNRSRTARRSSSAASAKAAQRHALEQAEAASRRNSASRASSAGASSSHSRQPTPHEGYVRAPPPSSSAAPAPPASRIPRPRIRS